ncbi:MAG TPA: VOC family protein [Bryobacteraceae bacterium]|nr:VOC family protein [Bryobacteraceae bacterium]
MSNGARLSQISIIMLGVGDLPRSVAFYSEVLGLEVRNQIPGFAFLVAGGITLALSEALGTAHGGAPLPGATEVVFSVASVRQTYEGLKSKGLTFTHEPRNVTGSFWAANFNDPDGHKLSIFGEE